MSRRVLVTAPEPASKPGKPVDLSFDAASMPLGDVLVSAATRRRMAERAKKPKPKV